MSASKGAKLIAVTMAMGFGVLVFTLFQIFAPETPTIIVAMTTILPVLVGFTADLIGFADSPTLEVREVPE